MPTNAEISAAVKRLRQEIGDSQQAFATRLGISIATAVRYEHGRTPIDRNLVKLEDLARECDVMDCADVFRRALAGRLGQHIAPVAHVDPPDQSMKEIADLLRKLLKVTEDAMYHLETLVKLALQQRDRRQR